MFDLNFVQVAKSTSQLSVKLLDKTCQTEKGLAIERDFAVEVVPRNLSVHAWGLTKLYKRC